MKLSLIYSINIAMRRSTTLPGDYFVGASGMRRYDRKLSAARQYSWLYWEYLLQQSATGRTNTGYHGLTDSLLLHTGSGVINPFFEKMESAAEYRKFRHYPDGRIRHAIYIMVFFASGLIGICMFFSIFRSV